ISRKNIRRPAGQEKAPRLIFPSPSLAGVIQQCQRLRFPIRRSARDRQPNLPHASADSVVSAALMGCNARRVCYSRHCMASPAIIHPADCCERWALRLQPGRQRQRHHQNQRQRNHHLRHHRKTLVIHRERSRHLLFSPRERTRPQLGPTIKPLCRAAPLSHTSSQRNSDCQSELRGSLSTRDSRNRRTLSTYTSAKSTTGLRVSISTMAASISHSIALNTASVIIGARCTPAAQ